MCCNKYTEALNSAYWPSFQLEVNLNDTEHFPLLLVLAPLLLAQACGVLLLFALIAPIDRIDRGIDTTSIASTGIPNQSE